MALQVKDAAGSTVTVSYSTARSVAQGNTAIAVKASGGRVAGYTVYNPNSSDVYLHFYDIAAGSVTPGTSTPIWSDLISGQSSARLSLSPGIDFATAISCNASTAADGSGAPGSNLIRSVAYV